MRCPARVYQDPEIYEQEIRQIFLKSWLYVGHQSQVPERGDYFLFEMAGESVIIVRDGEGDDQRADERVPAPRLAHLRRRRRATRRGFTCRYHGWTYGLDGSLRAAAPHAGGIRHARSYGLQAPARCACSPA